jgi:hypothetical protein
MLSIGDIMLLTRPHPRPIVCLRWRNAARFLHFTWEIQICLFGNEPIYPAPGTARDPFF